MTVRDRDAILARCAELRRLTPQHANWSGDAGFQIALVDAILLLVEATLAVHEPAK